MMSTSVRGAVRTVALLAALGCAACGDPPPKIGNCGVSATADADISEQGPFNIGFKRFPITYSAPAESGARTIMVSIWYPTKDVTGTGVTYTNTFPDPQSWENASLAPPLSSCGYPTIEYSHGDYGVAGGAAYMMRHFASHGWVALAPDHTDDTLSIYPTPVPFSDYYERPLDMSQVLDAMDNLRPEDPLRGKIATDKVLLVGHSRGTETVWASAGGTFDPEAIVAGQTDPPPSQADLAVFEKGLRDPRVVAGIPMAGTIDQSLFGPSGESSVHIPLLQMTGSANNVGQSPQEFMSLTNSPMYWIDILGACHESFNLAIYDPCQPPATLDAETGYKIVRTYALAFARYYVLGDRSALVSGIVHGTTQVSDLVDVFMEH